MDETSLVETAIEEVEVGEALAVERLDTEACDVWEVTEAVDCVDWVD